MNAKDYFASRDHLTKSIVEIGKEIIETKSPTGPNIEELLRFVLRHLSVNELKHTLEILKKTRVQP